MRSDSVNVCVRFCVRGTAVKNHIYRVDLVDLCKFFSQPKNVELPLSPLVSLMCGGRLNAKSTYLLLTLACVCAHSERKWLNFDCAKHSSRATAISLMHQRNRM